MLDTVQNTLYNFLLSQEPKEVISNPILQVKKWELRALKSLAQSDSARRWWLGFEPGCPNAGVPVSCLSTPPCGRLVSSPASPRSMLEMQDVQPQPRPTESGSGGPVV